MNDTKQIKPSEYYMLKDLVAMRVLHFGSFRKVRAIIKHDHEENNILKPIVTGRGVGKRYLFKGENIIRFLKGVDAGKVKLP